MCGKYESLYIVDAGAFHGELKAMFEKYHLPVAKWYCFEADIDNYLRMCEIHNQYGDSNYQVCVNYGLWNTNGIHYFEKDMSSASHIAEYQTDTYIKTTTIDDYIGEKKCNFIKMDIEGAEYNALLGGLKTMKRERPILAISIYHSLEDFYRIPELLMKELSGYSFLIRHHSMIFSETVLYGIPEERVS